jgi:membrane fusion protein (multidrug efflux system)
MKPSYISLSLSILALMSCSSEKENKTVIEKFSVISPYITDTVSTTEYVADIHSVQNVEIRARVRGYIEEIYVDEGKTVKAGQLLFSISNNGYKEALVRAQASLKSAVAEAKAAEVDLMNVKKLVERNVISKTELEMAQAKFDAANARIEEADSDEANAKLNLSFTKIKAPFDGIINRIPNKTGSLIDEGTLLTSISDNKEVFAYFSVSEREYLDINAQNSSEHKKQVDLLLANNEPYPLKGTIETVEGEFDKSTGNIAFRARFDNPQQLLKHGSSGKILLKKQLKNAMLIPQKSTFEIQDKLYVFVIDKKNVVRMKSIIPKCRLDYLFVVESGLSPNDKIIYEGIQQVKEGDKISPQYINLGEMINSSFPIARAY